LDPKKIKLQHRPHGWDHPYEQDIDERTPREPLVGEAIQINAISEPPGSLKDLILNWKFEDGDWHEEPVDQIADEGSESDRWQARIPAQTQPGHLVYKLKGQTTEGEVSSTEEFSVEITQWVKPDRLANVHQRGRVLDLLFGFDELGLAISFRYYLGAENNLIFERQLGGWEQPPVNAYGNWKLVNAREKNQIWENGEFKIVIDPVKRTSSIQRDSRTLLVEVKSFEILVTADHQIKAYRQYFESKDDEIFMGLGERFNALDQRGECLDTRVFEQYRRQGSKTYIPIPFYLSSRGYGLFQEASRKAEFDFPAVSSQPLTITQSTGSALSGRTVLFTEPVWEENARKFTRFVASPVMPPIWAFGLWMSSNEWYNQAEVLRQVDLMHEYEIPATVLVIEAWSDEENFYIWNDAQYELKEPSKRFKLSDFTFPEDGLWPDPKGMADQLHNEGLKLILWQIPVLKHLKPEDIERHGVNPQHDRDEAYWIEQGYCVHNPDGSPYRVPPIWFSHSLVWDVTNPNAVDWWLSQRQYLLEEIGVDGFKTDGGEHLWGDDLKFYDGRTSAELINEFPKIYQQYYYDFANRFRPEGGVNFSRAGYTGSQTSPLHWAGDQDSTWESYRAVLLAGQNLGLGGVPFWGWDIGGFSGPIPSADLYLRSTAAATFAPVMQYHSEHNEHRPVSVDRTPWNMQEQTGDERVVPIFRKYANLRMNLLPYLYSEAVHTSQTGQPMFGCPLVRFQDREFLNYPYQFTCGRYILVAPVTAPDVKDWPVYLPEGHWVDFWTGETFEGGREWVFPIDLEQIPVFVREGAILPFNLNEDLTFGSKMSNDLSRYDTLTLVQFGKSDPDFRYEWHDYLTGETFIISSETNPQQELKSLKDKIKTLAKKRLD
jgi:alpha-D-xyloside xylohydrolase